MLNKIGKHIIFSCSILFFLGTTYVLYIEYKNYTKRVKRYAVTTPTNIENGLNFTIAEVNVLENYRIQRNILSGYDSFLKQSAKNYFPDEYSYANTLKEKFIAQLDNIKFTQPYWDAIFTSFYTDISTGKNIALDSYDAIMRIPTEYENAKIDGVEDINIIEKIATEEYWKRQVLEFDRTPQNIKSVWKRSKGFFYTFVSKSKYDKRCKNVIEDLVEIYERITQKSNYREFYKTYNVNDSIFHTFPTANYVKQYNYSWPFSFWDRRFTEKNDLIVYDILKEIQNHYEN